MERAEKDPKCVNTDFHEWWHHLLESQREAMAGALWGVWLGNTAGRTRTMDFADERGSSLALGEAGELTLCLWKALCASRTSEEMSAQGALNYRAWWDSVPASFEAAHAVSFGGPLACPRDMRERAGRYNRACESAGALKRCVPLAIAAVRWKLSGAALDRFVHEDVCLTHRHPRIALAVVAYVRLLRHLFLIPGDGPGAIRSVKAWMAKQDDEVLKDWWHRALEGRVAGHEEAAESAGSAGSAAPVDPDWVRYAWVLAFACVRLDRTWEDGVNACRWAPGLSETNAAAVGGALGAFHGVRMLPKVGMDAVSSRCPFPAERPAWLLPRHWMSAHHMPAAQTLLNAEKLSSDSIQKANDAFTLGDVE